VFVNGIFTPSVVTRVSLYPHRSRAGRELDGHHGAPFGGQRYRYGRAVDTFRRGGASLDDCSLTNRGTCSLYRDILFRWNGFRIYYQRHLAPQCQAFGPRRHRVSSLERTLVLSASFSMSMGVAGAGGGMVRSSSLLDATQAVPSHQRFSLSQQHRGKSLGAGLGGGVLNSSTGSEGSNSDEDGVLYADGGESTSRGLSDGGSVASSSSSSRVDRRGHFRRSASWVPGGFTGSHQGGAGWWTQQGAVRHVGRPLVVQHGTMSDKYDIIQQEVLGEGTYASVYVATDKATGRERAVKAIKRRYLFSEEEKATVKYEIENMFRAADHRNVIRLYETFETPEHVYLVMERATHGNLEQILQLRRKLTELEAMWVAKQLLDALEYMHSRGVLHCDVKPHNLLFSDVHHSVNDKVAAGSGDHGGRKMWMYTSPLGMVLKVCDFGLSRKVPDVRYYKHTGDINKVPFSRLTGTGGYMAPEIMQRQSYGKPADLWSVGVVVFRVLCGVMPFLPPAKCLEQPVAFKGRVWDQISNDAKAFVASLLTPDQTRRPTAKQALAHPWLSTVPEWGPQLAVVRSALQRS
jgi:hypothetical protein